MTEMSDFSEKSENEVENDWFWQKMVDWSASWVMMMMIYNNLPARFCSEAIKDEPYRTPWKLIIFMTPDFAVFAIVCVFFQQNKLNGGLLTFLALPVVVLESSTAVASSRMVVRGVCACWLIVVSFISSKTSPLMIAIVPFFLLTKTKSMWLWLKSTQPHWRIETCTALPSILQCM